MSGLLWRSLWRHLLGHPWQLGLALLGIALGVAVVLAVELANASARASFAHSLAQVAGQATHRISGGPAGVPETVYRELRVAQGFRQVAPVVTGYAAVPEQPGQLWQVLGLDPFAEAPFREPLTALGTAADTAAAWAKLLSEPASALLPPELATQDQVVLRVGERRVTLRRVGVLPAELTGLLITDIATAQVLFNRVGRLSHIDLILPDGETGERLAATLRRALPAGLRLERSAERNQATLELSAAFSLNLTALSLLALVVGMFLIYNTMTFAVVQRRQLLGLLRAIGVSRRELYLAVLGEALLLGVVGTLWGTLLGIWLGSGLVQLVTRTVNDLYYVLNVRMFHLDPGSLLKVVALGLLATLVAAWLPAREAARAPPGAALSRAYLEARWQAALPRLNLAGGGLLLLGGLVLAGSSSLLAGFVAVFLLLLGASLLVPAAVPGLVRLAQTGNGWQGLPERLALRAVSRHLSRTGVAIAALMVALAATIGIGVMVDSFRGGVSLWIQDLINADIYLAPPNLEDGDYLTPLRPEVVAVLATVPGVAAVSTYRRSTVELDGRPVQLVAVALARAAQPGYRLIEGKPANAWPALEQDGAVIVSEPLAYRAGLHAGQTLILPTAEGPRPFPIAGVFLDYGSEHGRILIHQSTYQRLWHDPAVGSAAVYAAPDVDAATLRQRLRERVGPLQDLILRSNRDIQNFTLAVFDRTFAITQVLRLLAVLVAGVGIVSALLALQLERAREFAVLRAVGMTSGEVGRLVTLQSGVMGLFAGLLAIPVGLGLAGLLIYVINRRAFGWTLPFQVDPWLLVQAVLLSVVAAVVAGLYPIWRTARSQPVVALRME